MSKRIGFIGVGKLGQACAEIMAETHTVTGYDVQPRTPSNFAMSSTLAGAVKNQDIVFVAVQTPHDSEYDGSTPTSHLPVKDFDYSTVQQVLTEVNQHATPNQLIVLISTVLPGTTRREFAPLITNARFLYNPYLIAMGTVKWDMVNPEMVMIGTEDGNTSGSALELKAFYDTILENSPRYVIGTWEEIESTKVFYNCYSEDTEVLTDRGWVLFSQARDGDRVFSLDPNTMIPEWVAPTKWVSRDWTNSMIHFRSTKDDILVTPGHNMFAGFMTTKKNYRQPGMKWGYHWKLVPAEELIQKSGFVFQRSSEWHNNSPDSVEIGGVQVPSDLYVQFMAWFLSEGCLSGGRIIISQDRDANPEKYEMIAEMMMRLSQYYPGNNKLCEGKSGLSLLWPEFANNLVCYGKSFDKYIPNTIKDMGRDMIRLFLDTYNLGDGSAMHTKRFDGTRSQSDRAYKYYATSSNKMAADLGELIIKVGRFPSYRTTRSNISKKDCHLVYELLGKTSNYQKSSTVGVKFSEIDYNGKVYCAVLPKNHVFLTRRNGKCTWQGNTFISAKVGLVNMVQDVAERLGHMNAELVCDALAQSTRRIMGPAYMKPGMSDGGACVLPDFSVIVNDEKTSMLDLHSQFSDSTVFLVNSCNYAITAPDEKKIHQVTCREYSGPLIVFETDAGLLKCTPEHLLPVLRNNKRVIVRADQVIETDRLFLA